MAQQQEAFIAPKRAGHHDRLKKKTKRWIAVATTLTAVAFAGLNVLAYNHAHAMMHFTIGGERTSKPEEPSGEQRTKRSGISPLTRQLLSTDVDEEHEQSTRSTRDPFGHCLHDNGRCEYLWRRHRDQRCRYNARRGPVAPSRLPPSPCRRIDSVNVERHSRISAQVAGRSDPRVKRPVLCQFWFA